MINVDAPRSFPRIDKMRGCPACRYRPDGQHEHEDMLADLTVVWWVIAHGRIRRTRHCCQCAPKDLFASIDCVYCGDGPLVVLMGPSGPAGAHALTRTALTTTGWITTPAGEWVCRDCQTAG
jgi:hypothetical protein